VATSSTGTEKPTRRTAIADAAIELLAESGTRGLTHRMVDRRLGIPEGSTGAYHRTRQALLEATARRVGELDMAEIHEAREIDMGDGDVAETITALVLSTNAPEHHSRFLARNVLFMEAANNQELAQIMEVARHGYFESAKAMVSKLGVKEPRVPARALGAFMAGLIIGQVVYTEPTLAPDEVLESVRRFLAGWGIGDEPPAGE
jgi:DNA-binding transcriptional regulator YbjK